MTQATVLPDLRHQLLVNPPEPGPAWVAWVLDNLLAGAVVWVWEARGDAQVRGRQAPGAGLGGNTAPAGGQAAAPAGGAFGGIGGFGAPRNPRGNEDSSDPSEIGAAEILKDAVLPTAPARLPSGTTYYIYPVTFEVELDQSGATPPSEFDEYSSDTKKTWNGEQA